MAALASVLYVRAFVGFANAHRIDAATLPCFARAMSDDSFQKPGANERVIRPVADDSAAKRLSSARIAWFTKNHLKQIAVGDSGWSKLFLDSVEQRYWELTFPSGSEHGGGAPELRELTIDVARERYGLAV